MPVNRPYRRTCRQFVNENNLPEYILHPKFAQEPVHYIRAFLLLLKDLQELFDYVEPADKNLACFSYRVHALLLRACVEVEANCKAIFKENGYVETDGMTMKDYKKINKTHLLSSYQVKVPNWRGDKDMRSPFLAWANGNALPWYKAYNASKHDRHFQFEEATFEHLIDACCGLLVLLAAQFGTHDFFPRKGHLLLEGSGDGMETGIGGYFRVNFPDDWPVEERYDFDWQVLKDEEEPFQSIDYSQIT